MRKPRAVIRLTHFGYAWVSSPRTTLEKYGSKWVQQDLPNLPKFAPHHPNLPKISLDPEPIFPYTSTMSNAITKITPEGFDIANGFLMYGTVEDTAEQLQVPRHEVVRVLQTPEVKRYLDGVYLDQGYRNRDKLGRLLDEMIESKLEEARESGVYTSKDLLELLQMAHKMRMDEIKAAKEAGQVPGVAVQVNNQFGDSNYGRLMEKLIG